MKGRKGRVGRGVSVVLSLLLVAMVGASWGKEAGDARQLTVKEAVAIALENSPLLKAGASSVKAQAQLVRMAQAAYLPTMDLEASYTRLSDPVAVVPIKGFGPNQRPPFFSKNIYEWKITSSFSLYDGGRITNGVRMRRLAKEARENQWEWSKEEVVASVVDTFNRCLYLRRLLAAQEETLKALRKVREDTANLLKVGRVAPVDLMRVDAQVAAQEQELVATRELLHRTVRFLDYLLGWPVTTPLVLKGDLVMPSSAGLPEASLDVQSRPDVRAALKKVEEARTRVSYEWGGHLPRIYLAGSYGKRAGAGFKGLEEVWQAGIFFKINLFSGGAISARVREARARLREAQRLLEEVKLKASREVLDALSALSEAQKRLIWAQASEKSARESFRIERLKYLSGAGTVTDMLLSQSQWAQARAKYYQALYDYNSALVAYRKATATLLAEYVENKGGVKR